MTIALGIFNASTARTVNNNESDRIGYIDGGADVVILEQWTDNADMVEDDETGRTKLAYNEPDYNKYTTIPGLESITKVVCEDEGHCYHGRNAPLQYRYSQGIHTKEFGQTASLKDGLLPEHFYDYLNVISSGPMQSWSLQISGISTAMSWARA